MENRGPPRTFLGINIFRGSTTVNGSSASTISINQSGYIERMITRFQMQNARPARTPLDHSLPLVKATPRDKRADPTEYQEITGSINYVSIITRPDITFAANKLSQFNSDPTITHIKAARHLLRYLNYTKHFALTFGGASNLNTRIYADADWGNDRNDGRSISGIIVIINNGPVFWSSRKQPSVATSTMEAEYIALSDASRECIARMQLFSDLHIQVNKPVLLCDNQAALSIVRYPVHHQRSKHIAIRYHYIRDAFNNGKFDIQYVPSAEQLADILTKALPLTRHYRCVDAILQGVQGQ